MKLTLATLLLCFVYCLICSNNAVKRTYDESNYMEKRQKRARETTKQQNKPLIKKRKQLEKWNKKNKNRSMKRNKLKRNKKKYQKIGKMKDVFKQKQMNNKKGNAKKLRKNNMSKNTKNRSKQRKKKSKVKAKNSKKKSNKNNKPKAAKGRRKKKMSRNGNQNKIKSMQVFKKNKNKSKKHANRKKNQKKNKNRKPKKTKPKRRKFKKGPKKTKNKKSKKPRRKHFLSNDFDNIEVNESASRSEDYIYPVLDAKNVNGTYRIIRVIFETQNDGTWKEVQLQRDPNGMISVTTLEKRYNVTTEMRDVVSESLQYIYECWDHALHCVANWNSNCLNKMFNETVLKILEAKRSTRDGVACDYWNDTNWIGYSNTVENRCVLNLKTPNGIFYNLQYPFCMATYVEKPCFTRCNPDLGTIIVNNNTGKFELRRPFGKCMVLEPIDGKIVKVCGRNKNKETINVDVWRCYDKDRQCVANVNGSCLEDFLDDDAVRVLSNANVTAQGEPCLCWNTTEHRKDVPYPNSNLCALPTDSAWNGDGPWCHKEQGLIKHGPCFPDCESLRTEWHFVDIWDNPQYWINYDSDPPYPLLSYKNRIVGLKLKTTVRHRPKYAILNWNFDGSVKVAIYTLIRDRITNFTITDTIDETILKRCYNPLKNCIAEWTGICLNENFGGIILEILQAEAYGINGFKCDSWELLPLPDYETLKGDRCVNDTERSFATNDGPFCFTGGKRSSCFPLCQIAVAKQVLGPTNQIVILRQLNNKRINLNWISATQFKIVGDVEYPVKKAYDSVFERCYDRKQNCVSVVNGTCLEFIFPQDVVTVLHNHVHTRFGKECIDWSVTSFYTYGSENAPRNLCSQPRADYYPTSLNGPWCYTKEDGDLGPENCFDDCDYYRGSDQSAPERLRDCGDQYVYSQCDAERGILLQSRKALAAQAGCQLKLSTKKYKVSCRPSLVNPFKVRKPELQH